MRKDRGFRLPRLNLPRLNTVQWLTVALIAIAVLAFVNEVRDLQYQIRQAKYATVVSNIRAALIEHWVDRQVLPQQYVANGNTAISNPMQLLKQVPENYLGALNQTPDNARDIWFFDTQQHCLVYVDVEGKPHLHPLVSGNASRGMLGGWDLAPAENGY
jgi:hypothetical protein